MFRLFLVISGLVVVSSSRHQHFYRKDYTYFEEFDAFYKLHWDNSGIGINWSAAFKSCDDEGSQLFYPKLEGEWTVVKNLSDSLKEAPSTNAVIVGVRDETGQGEFVTVDGQVTPKPISEDPPSEGQKCVVMEMDTGLYKYDFCDERTNVDEITTPRLYVCKKTDEKKCPTIDLGYQFKEQTNKCYKINKLEMTWMEAYHTCFVEGGILVAPDNDAENQIIAGLTEDGRTYFAGFKRLLQAGTEYYTVKGRRLEISGFPGWYGDRNRDGEDCGALYDNGNSMLSYSSSCYQKLQFICEMQAKV